MQDLGLSYEAAAHGVQSAIRYEMTQKGIADDTADEVLRMLKHLRVGVDCRASDAGAMARLLIGKGVFTEAEYLEAMRLAINDELAGYETQLRSEYGLPPGADFR